ncbi:MAG: hypothetical protein IJC48_06730, partial [Clostridia bacterium]|nr:hypothetical protein [Clostridia bacterium]
LMTSVFGAYAQDAYRIDEFELELSSGWTVSKGEEDVVKVQHDGAVSVIATRRLDETMISVIEDWGVDMHVEYFASKVLKDMKKMDDVVLRYPSAVFTGYMERDGIKLSAVYWGMVYGAEYLEIVTAISGGTPEDALASSKDIAERIMYTGPDSDYSAIQSASVSERVVAENNYFSFVSDEEYESVIDARDYAIIGNDRKMCDISVVKYNEEDLKRLTKAGREGFVEFWLSEMEYSEKKKQDINVCNVKTKAVYGYVQIDGSKKPVAFTIFWHGDVMISFELVMFEGTPEDAFDELIVTMEDLVLKY